MAPSLLNVYMAVYMCKIPWRSVLLTSNPQVDRSRLGFPAVIGRRAGVETGVDASHSLEDQGAGGDDDAPRYILGDRLSLERNGKSTG